MPTDIHRLTSHCSARTMAVKILDNTFLLLFFSSVFCFLIFLYLTRDSFKVSQAATFQVNYTGSSTNRWCGCYFIIQHQQLFKVHIIKTYVSVIVTTTKNNICYMFFIFLCFPERRPTSPHILQLHETKNYSFELLNIILLNVIFVRPRWRQVLRGLW